MAKRIPELNVELDTFQSWIERTNELIAILSSEVLTANGTGGITGSTQAPLNSRLIGSFTANTLVGANSFSANSTVINLSGSALTISGIKGSQGQVLTSNGSVVFWADSSSSSGGGVTSISTGVGLSGGPIQNSGSIQVRANSGIIANNSGLFTDDAYIRGILGQGTSVSQLLGFTWEVPGAIGANTANTGTFTTVVSQNTYRLGNSTVISNNAITSLGSLIGKTLNPSSAAALILRARDDNAFSSIHVTNANGSNQWANVQITNDGWNFDKELSFLGGVQVGYRNIPQQIVSSNTSLNTSSFGGQHLYKTSGSAITIAIPDNAELECPIGTAITIVNDSATGNITLGQSGSTILQLAGSLTTGDRIISGGGVATLLKVQTDKWIISGVGVS